MDQEAQEADLPIDAQGHLDRAYTWEEEGEFEQALAECEATLRLESSLAEAHNLRGILLEELDRPEEALEAYKRALRLDPAFRDARENLSELQSGLAARSELVTIARYNHVAEAHVTKARLQALNIPAFVADEHIATMNWLWSNAMGGVKVQVRRADAAQALRTLEQQIYQPSRRKDNPHCPRCGAFDVRYQRYGLRKAFTAMLVLALPPQFSVLPFVLTAALLRSLPLPLLEDDLLLALALWTYYWLMIPLPKNKWRCRRCGHEWKRVSHT